MSTLVQQFVENAFIPKGYDGDAQLIHDIVYSRLVPSFDATVLEMRTLAERFVFEEDPVPGMQEMVERGALDKKVAYQSTYLLASPSWIEAPVNYNNGVRCKLGVLVENFENRTFFAFVSHSPTRRAPFTLASMSCPQLPGYRAGQDRIKVHSRLKGVDDEELTRLFQYALCWLFTLCTPRVTTYVDVKHDDKLQKTRAKRREQPLLEYRRVRSVIGVAVRHRNTNISVDPAGRSDGTTKYKMHRVLPFFRAYHVKNKNVPEVKFIAEHWRGDPSLGIIIKERVLVQPEAKL